MKPEIWHFGAVVYLREQFLQTKDQSKKPNYKTIAMRRKARFILNFVIGFLFLLICWLSFLLVSHAPMPIGGSIAGARIGIGSQPFYIPGHEFSCTKKSNLARCVVTLANRPLKIEIAYSDSNSNVIKCLASYAGLSTNCTPDFNSIIIGGWLPVADIDSNLGFTNLQLQQLQMQALEKKNIVLQLSEDNLVIFVTVGIAFAIGVVSAASGWLYFGKFTKVVASICLGFVAFRVCWNWLGRIPFGVMLDYGLNEDTWTQLVDWITIVVGITTSIATTRLLWSQRNQFVKMFVCISSGFGAFALSWFFFLYSLLALGYAD